MKDKQLLILKGDHFSRGLKHGEVLSEEISISLQNIVKEIGVEKLSNTTPFQSLIKDYLSLLNQYMPELLIELEGMAQGAHISVEESIILQFKREIIKTNHTFDCTTYAAFTNNQNFISQTIDLSGSLGNFPIIMQIELPNGESIYSFSFAGLLGYLGMNNHIAVGINMVWSPNWMTGISPYLIVRYLLQYCNSVEEALDAIKKLPRASSRTLIVLDKTSLCYTEFDSKHRYHMYKNQILHTNHFTIPEMQAYESLHPFLLSSSKKRLNRLAALIANYSNEKIISNHILKEIFSDHDRYPSGICAHSDNDSRPKTVGAVFMSLSDKKFDYVLGNPCINKVKHLF